MITIKNISKTFFPNTNREHQGLKSVSLTIEKGDFITIVGGNGAGKSTFLNAISGSFPIDQGQIIIGDTDVTTLSEAKRAKFISRVYQNPLEGTAPRMTVEENMALALRRGKRRTLRKASKKAELALFKTSLKKMNLGLENRLSAEMGLLSGGQRQAIALLMATLQKPELLLLDEHTAALDPKTERTIMALTKEKIEQENLTAMMITHNLQDALNYGNRLIVLHRGEIVRDFNQKEKSQLTTTSLYQLLVDLDEQTVI